MDDVFVLNEIGECMPVATTDKTGSLGDVFCQDCTKPMTLREHKGYFDKYAIWFEKKFNREYSKAGPTAQLHMEEERKGE